MKSAIKKIGVLVVLILASSRASANGLDEIYPRLSANIGVRPMAAINSAPVLSNTSGESVQGVGADIPPVGAGIGGFGDLYLDNMMGIELSYNTLFQNQLGAASVPNDVKRQTMSYFAYVLKYKPHGDTEYGIGGVQFNWESPTDNYKTISGDGYSYVAKNYGSAPVSAPGLILQAGFPIKYGRKFNASTTLQGFYVPGNLTRLYGITAGISFGYNLFTGNRVPVMEKKTGVPYGKKLPWQ